MKILLVINTLSSGGAEVFVTDLALEFNKLKNDVIVLIYGGIIDNKGVELKNKLNINGIRVINLDIKNNLLKITIPLRFAILIHKIKPTVIHSHLDQSDFFVAVAKLLLPFYKHKALFVRTLHNNNVIKRIPLIINSWVFRQYNKTFSCSISVKEDFQIEKYRNRILPIPNGISLSKIKEKNFDNKEISSGYINILSIGSFDYRHGILQKGQDILIRAAYELNYDNVLYHFIGNGSAFEKMVNLSKSLNIKNKCIFHGQLNNIFNIINSCQFVCFPSRFEGLPIAAIESVLMGKPIIVSDIKAFEPFEDSSKVIFSSGNHSDLALKISSSLARIDPLIKAAKANILIHEERFDIHNVANKYLINFIHSKKIR